MDDTNRTDSRHPAQSSVIATGFDLKACREGSGGDDTAVAYGMVAGLHRITSSILHDHYQTCTSPVPSRRDTGHQTQTERTCAGHRASDSDSSRIESTAVRRAHMEFAPTVGSAIGSRCNAQSTIGSQTPSTDGRSLHSFLPYSETQTGLSGGGAGTQQPGQAQKKCVQGKLTLAFVDECGFSPSQPVNYSWTARGERKYVPYENPNRRRTNVMAAMISDGRTGSLV